MYIYLFFIFRTGHKSAEVLTAIITTSCFIIWMFKLTILRLWWFNVHAISLYRTQVVFFFFKKRKEKHSENEPRSVMAVTHLHFYISWQSQPAITELCSENVLAQRGEAPTDTGFTQCTFCSLSGDFPLGVCEEPGPPLVTQNTSLPNARMFRDAQGKYIGRWKSRIFDRGAKIFGQYSHREYVRVSLLDLNIWLICGKPASFSVPGFLNYLCKARRIMGNE